MPYIRNNDFIKSSQIFDNLTEEGKQKILDYIFDIGEIEKYQRQ